MRHTLEDGPRHVLNDADSELQGHYEATFSGAQGERVERYLTDNGRAELLRLVDAGQRSFVDEEFERLTTPASMKDLLSAMEAEGGVGG